MTAVRRALAPMVAALAFIIVVPATEAFPPPVIYVSPTGEYLPFAGPQEVESKTLARVFAIYRLAGRTTPEGREVYEYEGGGAG